MGKRGPALAPCGVTTARYDRGCRCDDCKAAKAARGREYRARTRTPPKPQTLKPCGTHAAYRRGCRCDDCRQAQAVRVRTYLQSNPAARATQAELARRARERDGDYLRARDLRRLDEQQKATSARAINTGQPWSSTEDRVATDSTLTTTQAAFALGRTYSAVKSRRETLRDRSTAA